MTLSAYDTWEVAKIAIVMFGAVMAPVIAVDVDIVRYKKWGWFHPKDGYSSVIIMLMLLFCLAYITRPWRLPFPWPGIILPVSAVTWHFYFRKRLSGSVG